MTIAQAETTTPSALGQNVWEALTSNGVETPEVLREVLLLAEQVRDINEAFCALEERLSHVTVISDLPEMLSAPSDLPLIATPPGWVLREAYWEATSIVRGLNSLRNRLAV